MNSLSVSVLSFLYHENQKVFHFVVVSMLSFMYSKNDVVGGEYLMNIVRRSEIGIQSTPGTSDGVNSDSSEKYFGHWKCKNKFVFA